MSSSAPALGKPPSQRGGPFAWVGAFTGFYPAEASEFSHLDPVTRFLYAARSVILVISAQAAIMAGLLAGLVDDPDALRRLDGIGRVLRFANATGALATTTRGAVSALPDRAAIARFLASDQPFR